MSGFGIDHLPYGAYTGADGRRRIGVRLEDDVIDLSPLELPELDRGSMNDFLALGRATWESTRAALIDLIESGAAVSTPLADVELHLPFEVGDYVDFYCSLEHASNVGQIFRPDSPALPPNWRHLPIGYHGRSGTVVVSGTPVIRPCGQRKAPAETAPTYGPSERLDIEAELGFVVGTGSGLGSRIATTEFADHVFGVVGLNDWSARDVQAWEYVPLGPFLGKSFATSVSAWVTPLQALEAAWTALPGQDPEPMSYLRIDGRAGLDIDVEVELNGEVVSRPPYSSMYWSPAQMLAHLTVNGASTRPGDLFGSGTISGASPAERGSFLELSWGGTQPFAGDHTFLRDGDEVVLRYSAPGTRGGRICLGEVAGRVLPADHPT